MSGYHAQLKDKREIFIPDWSPKVGYENLTKACKVLGQEEVINISALNVPAAMLAVMGSDDAELSTRLVFHFVSQVRIENEKITEGDIHSMSMAVIIELFTHVMHSQYNDFFESGLVKEPSPV